MDCLQNIPQRATLVASAHLVPVDGAAVARSRDEIIASFATAVTFAGTGEQLNRRNCRLPTNVENVVNVWQAIEVEQEFWR